MVRLDDINIFVAIADNASMTAAARKLDVTTAVASASLKRLEQELKTRLIARSTRSLRLTPDGERYLLHAREALAAVYAGQDALTQCRQTIGGNVSLSMPSDLGRSLLSGWLDEFQEQHPLVSLTIRLGDRLTDLYKQPVDLAVRYGKPEDSSLVALPLDDDNRRVLCGSPEYFAKHGRPVVPTDLVKHNCLRYSLGEAIYQDWSFHRSGEQPAIVKVSGDRISDDAELVHRWALAGKGLAYKSRLDVLASLRAGKLEIALSDFTGELAPLRLVCPHRLMISPTVTALREFMRTRVREYTSAPLTSNER